MRDGKLELRPLRIYIDTSVLGGCFDVEFALWSNALARDFRAGRLIPVLSDVTAAEVADAPPAVRDLHQEMLLLAEKLLPVTPDVVSLVASYEAKKILPVALAADMTHIALGYAGAGRRSRELELQAHCATGEDSSVQCG